MAGNELIISEDKAIIENGSPEDLRALAAKKAAEIFQKISESNTRIADAKKEADAANAMETGWFGKTGAKTNAIAKALVATEIALAEMNDLIQESVRFTCASIEFSRIMRETMARMMVEGFRDRDGNIKQLSHDSQEAVQSIIDDADNFVRQQHEVEKKQAELRRRLDEKDKFDAEQNQRLEKLKDIFETEREKINKTFDKKNKIDKEQSERLENLQKLLAEKNQIDEKQENEIRLLVEYTKQKDILDKEQSGNIQKIMEELKLLRQKKTALVISIIALIISAGTLVFSVLRFYLQ